MSREIDVKYFNSFLVRKAVNGSDEIADWASLPWQPRYYPAFPKSIDTTDDTKNWFVEESRIRGGFNNNETDYGVRAYLADDESKSELVDYGLIYSGIYNPRTLTNQINVFSVGEDIEKTVDPRYGSIQRIHASDSDLLVMQEQKVSRAPIDRDIIYSANGSPTLVSTDATIGTIQPYNGEYGIGKFPESFAKKGYRTYFSDVLNSSVIRLSRDGFTEISKAGMEDFFRDKFNRLSTEYKKESIDLEWTIVWSTPITTITVSGDNISILEHGMVIEGIVGHQDIYIADIGTESGGSVVITLNKEITITQSPQPTVIQAIRYVKDRVVGGFDNYTDQYVISIQYNEPSRRSSSGLVYLEPDESLIPS